MSCTALRISFGCGGRGRVYAAHIRCLGQNTGGRSRFQDRIRCGGFLPTGFLLCRSALDFNWARRGNLRHTAGKFGRRRRRCPLSFLGGRFDFDLLFIASNSEKEIFAIAATVSGNRRKCSLFHFTMSLEPIELGLLSRIQAPDGEVSSSVAGAR
jgi:hypothetical protein